MKALREIIVFTNGDSSRLSTWSNVPYFFTETLMSRGIRVHRVDISPNPRLQSIWNKSVGRFVRRLTRMKDYDYFRSLVHYRDVKQRVRKALQEYPSADACLFLTFSFSSAGLTNKPTILFGDWTYDHYFRYHADKGPGWLEKLCLARENSEIEKADLVIVLFPGVADYMKTKYRNSNICYLGNVINSKLSADEQQILNRKLNSFDVLFIGSGVYREGALALISALKILRQQDARFALHIIGMKSSEFSDLPAGVTCYGYLDKSDDSQRELYYSLLTKARFFVNTTPKWAAFSATIEAMYFYTPVVVPCYDEFIKTFGDSISFGAYCEKNEANEIAGTILRLSEQEDYSSLCRNSHEAVKDFTWSSYVDNVIRRIEKIGS